MQLGRVKREHPGVVTRPLGEKGETMSGQDGLRSHQDGSKFVLALAEEKSREGGGSPGGLWSLLGAGLNSAVQKLDPSSVVTYQTSSGGFANISQTKSGKCDISIAHIGEIVIAEKGDQPFSSPLTGTRAIAMLYNWAPMQWLVDQSFANKYE